MEICLVMALFFLLLPQLFEVQNAVLYRFWCRRHIETAAGRMSYDRLSTSEVAYAFLFIGCDDVLSPLWLYLSIT